MSDTAARGPSPAPELADVIRRFGPMMPELSGEQRRVLSDLAACRTAALGGHMESCDHCGHQRPAYNSCRNRHCPKCQGSACADWVEARAADLLPVQYFHVVFTLPDSFNSLALGNKRVAYGMLFRAVSETLLEVAANPKRLGARVGFLAVLHTWGQNLSLHPHLHCVIPGGGLGAGGTQWIGCRPGFFLPVRVLSRVFRGKFIGLLRDAFHAGKLHGLADANTLEALIGSALAGDWVVYAKPPFGGPEQVLKYLARYTHRIAISNRRILAMGERTVSFEYKDYAHGNRGRAMTLEGTEFLRRFLMHAVPCGFVRVRYFGFLANRVRAANLERCRQLLHAPHAPHAAAPDAEPAGAEPAGAVKGPDGPDGRPGRRCPACGRGRMVPGQELARQPSRLPDLYSDTS
jgi:hypothetical protein